MFLLPSVASPARARRRHVLLVAPSPEETRGRHEWHALCLRDLVNRRGAPSDLEVAVCSHVLFMIAPNHWDPASGVLLRQLRLACKCDGCCGCGRRTAGWWRSSRRCTPLRRRWASAASSAPPSCSRTWSSASSSATTTSRRSGRHEMQVLNALQDALQINFEQGACRFRNVQTLNVHRISKSCLS